jgi:hypothetical protein
VWDEAARLPASDDPALMAAILHPFLISDAACFSNISGFEIVSIYSSLILELL